MEKISVFLFTLGMTVSAFAQQTQSNALNNGSFPMMSHNLNALTADPDEGTSISIGQGLNMLTGDTRKVCWDPAQVDEGSETFNRNNSSLTVIHTDTELKQYMQDQGMASVDYTGFGSSVSASASWNIMHSSDFNSNKISVIAKYDYLKSRHWYGGDPIFQSNYQNLLDTGNTVGFRDSCGDAYLQEVYRGASLVVVYDLVKTKSVSENDLEISAAIDAKYGPGKGSAKNTLTKRQTEILSGYSITYHCYADGGVGDVCQWVDNEGDISKSLKALTDAIANNPNQALVAMKPTYRTYDYLVQKNKFFDYQPFADNMDAWDAIKDDVNYSCNSLDYINRTDCSAANRSIDLQLSACAKASSDCRIPSPIEFYGKIRRYDDIGGAMIYQDNGYKGDSYFLRFSIDDGQSIFFDPSTKAFKPNVLYSLSQIGFDNIVSGFATFAPLSNNWMLELYENPDGSGKKMTTNGLKDGYGYSSVGSFNDKASSFRLVRKK